MHSLDCQLCRGFDMGDDSAVRHFLAHFPGRRLVLAGSSLSRMWFALLAVPKPGLSASPPALRTSPTQEYHTIPKAGLHAPLLRSDAKVEVEYYQMYGEAYKFVRRLGEITQNLPFTRGNETVVLGPHDYKPAPPGPQDIIIVSFGDHNEPTRTRDNYMAQYRQDMARVLRALGKWPGVAIYRTEATTHFNARKDGSGVYKPPPPSQKRMPGQCSPIDPSKATGQCWEKNMVMELLDECGAECERVLLLDMITPTLTVPWHSHLGNSSGYDCRHYKSEYQTPWNQFIATVASNYTCWAS